MGKVNNKQTNIKNNNFKKINRLNNVSNFPLPNSYYISILIRFIIGVLAIGYIHPDEYFQSPEITSSFMFNFKTFTPWEFSDSNPCRSVVIPLFNSGIPFFILKNLQKLVDYFIGNNNISIINGNTILMAPRIFMVLLSFSLDYYIVLICKSYNLSYRKSLSILSSCWLIIIFHSRTFSNTIESLLVATLLTLVLLYRKNIYKGENTLLKDLLIGMIVSCGIFARFTFIFFATPLGIYLLYLLLQSSTSTSSTSSPPSLRNTRKSKSKVSCIFSIILIIFGFLATSGFFIIIDSIYFNYLDHMKLISDFNTITSNINTSDLFLSSNSTIEIINQISNIPKHPLVSNLNSIQIISFLKNNLTYTPINSFLYNLDVDNLSDHGIHNRLTHLFVNLPMMVGPLVLLFFVEIISILKNGSNGNVNVTDKDSHHHYDHHVDGSSIKKNHQPSSSSSSSSSHLRKEVFPISIRVLLVSIIGFGLFFLSLAPHQEPRFLLPLFFPLALLSYRYFYFNKKSSKVLLVLWILFNMILTIFFGFVHQGGVTPSLVYIGSKIVKPQQQQQLFITQSNNNINNTNINNNKTRHNENLQKSNSKLNNITIMFYHTYMPPRYLLGIEKQNEKINLVDLGGKDINSLKNLVEDIKGSKIFILSPTKTILYQQYNDKICQLTESFWPHLTTEDPPQSIDELRLFMFECIDL
ncbi:hypothetical protein RB653_005021 [Dictyostelium firmibasis]|uniref:Mannosyltransferase n=1 Tax=Dictyostelium firmibasis TaxID=79012 RepID=A0AAN7UKC4_9MYCE